MRFIFDLDGTVIDSTHRLGDSLDDWRRLNTADNIAADSCLPLFDQMLLTTDSTLSSALRA